MGVDHRWHQLICSTKYLRLTVKTVGNSHRKPRILATGRYCDETVDGAEL